MKELGDDFNVITGKYTRRIISRLILERSLLLQWATFQAWNGSRNIQLGISK